MASDEFAKLTFEFLIRPESLSLGEVSNAIGDELRSATRGADPDQLGLHRPTSDSSEEEYDEYDDEIVTAIGSRRQIPSREWIFRQTEQLQDHLGKFGRLLQGFLRNQKKYPVMNLAGDLSPLDLSNKRYRSYRDAQPSFADDDSSSVLLVKPDQAAANFAEGYSKYLSELKLAAGKMPRNFPSHLHYTVKSRGRGFRLHSTPLYWMSPVVFGSSPTTPVNAYLPPGIYRFGGEKSRSPAIVWDSGQHNVSPSSAATHLSAF